jgi:hypothetical protein
MFLYLYRKFHNWFYPENKVINLADPEQNALLARVTYKYQEQKYDIQTECAICSLNFEENSIVKTLYPCGHIFHNECIRKWFYGEKIIRSKCPVCRKKDTIAEVNRIMQYEKIHGSYPSY